MVLSIYQGTDDGEEHLITLGFRGSLTAKSLKEMWTMCIFGPVLEEYRSMKETLTRDWIDILKECVDMLPDNTFIWENVAEELASRQNCDRETLTVVQMVNLMSIDIRYPAVSISHTEENLQNTSLFGRGNSDKLFFLVGVQGS